MDKMKKIDKFMLYIPILGMFMYLTYYINFYGLLFDFSDKRKDIKDIAYLFYHLSSIMLLIIFIIYIITQPQIIEYRIIIYR